MEFLPAQLLSALPVESFFKIRVPILAHLFILISVIEMIPALSLIVVYFVKGIT